MLYFCAQPHTFVFYVSDMSACMQTFVIVQSWADRCVQENVYVSKSSLKKLFYKQILPYGRLYASLSLLVRAAHWPLTNRMQMLHSCVCRWYVSGSRITTPLWLSHFLISNSQAAHRYWAGSVHLSFEVLPTTLLCYFGHVYTFLS